MRWIDRGPEPDGVAGYAQRYTQGWVDHFQNRVGERPTDFLWSVFRPTLGSLSNSICWYCERQCDADAEVGGLAPTVDHFRPLSRFPQLAYDWSNWIFSCRRCNEDNKKDNWPESGYVDPCAADVAERPEQYFDYDTVTGEIVANDGISGDAKIRAEGTIDDLGLNKWDMMWFRQQRILQFMDDLLNCPISERQEFIASNTVGAVEFSLATRKVIEQLRRDGHI